MVTGSKLEVGSMLRFRRECIPNWISVWRIPIGFILLGLIISQKHWQLTLWLYLVGLGTDAIDGVIARRLGVESPGQAFFENVGDYCVVGGPLLGLIIVDWLSLWLTGWVLAVAIVGVVLIRVDTWPHDRSRWYMRLAGGRPLIYVMVVVAVTIYLWLQAYHGQARFAMGVGLLSVFCLTAYLKRHRIGPWLHGHYTYKQRA